MHAIRRGDGSFVLPGEVGMEHCFRKHTLHFRIIPCRRQHMREPTPRNRTRRDKRTVPPSLKSFLLENLTDRFPVIICHVDGKFRVVDIQPIILVPDETPLETVFVSVKLEGIEFVLDLNIDVYILAL